MVAKLMDGWKDRRMNGWMATQILQETYKQKMTNTETSKYIKKDTNRIQA